MRFVLDFDLKPDASAKDVADALFVTARDIDARGPFSPVSGWDHVTLIGSRVRNLAGEVIGVWTVDRDPQGPGPASKLTRSRSFHKKLSPSIQ
jgi:hypothetical protein